MTNKMYFGALFCTGLLSLAGCSSSSFSDSVAPSSSEKPSHAASVITMNDSYWQVESIQQGGTIDYSYVTMSIDDGQISGSTGCNRYTGAVTLDAVNEGLSAFTVDNIALTRKMCAPALMKQEQKFVEALNETQLYSIDSGTWLVLLNGDKSETIKAISTSNSTTTTAPRASHSEKQPTAPVSQKQDVIDSKQTNNTKRYTCETPSANITPLEVSSLGPDTLGLSLNNNLHIVQLSRSASGAKYTNNKNVVFWNKGDDAILSINSGRYHCNLLK